MERLLKAEYGWSGPGKPSSNPESLKRRRCDGGKFNFLERFLGIARLLSQMVEPMLKAATLKRRRCDGGKFNFLERFLGIARLLSQMVEPMLKAATEISTLLARSFFMGFSLTILSLLGRLRVLVQQVLLDVVLVFNMVSSLSQKEQTVKINQEGFEVFREYYPINEQSVSLECGWETDKFVLVERINKSESKYREKNIGEDISLGESTIQYQSIEVLLGDDGSVKTNLSSASEEGLANIKQDDTSLLVGPVIESNNGIQLADGSGVAGPPMANLSPESGLLTSSGSSPRSNPSQLRSGSRSKVAFVSVKRPAPSTTKELDFHMKETGTNDGDKGDPFFGLLTHGNLKNSLF
ncbi:unnamed protein product [Ilex paraguariensis]|uniref:Uncharacterized protein n=1 Tax=Ilex paraguariensis TaxID=185542 RepID=A0ABC8S0C6_9AQUA